MWLGAADVAHIVSPDDSVRCSSCEKLENCCKTCATPSEPYRGLHAVFERFAELRKNKITDKQQRQDQINKWAKKRLNWKLVQESCSNAKNVRPIAGLDDWYDQLKLQTNKSQVDDDAILLTKTFDDKLLGWVLKSVPDIDYWATRPTKYLQILLHIMKTSLGTILGPNRPDAAVQARHEVAPAVAGQIIITAGATDAPSNALEEHTEEYIASPLPARLNSTIQPLDSPEAPERRADGRNDVDSHNQVTSESAQRNFKRLNDKDHPGRKRVCLQQNTYEVDETTSTGQTILTPIPVPAQELYISTSVERIHPLLPDPDVSLIEKVNPYIELIGEIGCTEKGDCSQVFLWEGYSAAALTFSKECLLESCGEFWKGRISRSLLEKLPFKHLVERIKCSETWKKQPLDCFIIWLQKEGYGWDGSYLARLGVAMVSCIVPRDEGLTTPYFFTSSLAA
jgi:hypothetical protein